MRLTIVLLGHTLDLSLEPTAAEEAEDDKARDLSGGATGSTAIDAGPTDRYLGFTGGWGDDD